MKKENRIRILSLLLMSLVLIISCDKGNDINILNNCETAAIFNPDKNYGTLTDQEGNVYKTIQIGSQTWMAENLRTTIYRNGDPIPKVTDSLTWGYLNTGAYCNYNNTESTDTICTYGRLYNWFTVNDDRNIAPEGWHVPTLDEWLILENYMENDPILTTKLKETGQFHWINWNELSTNETGFTALPGGCRWYIQGASGFTLIGNEGFWWTVTKDEYNLDNAHKVTIGFNYFVLGGCFCNKHDGCSIRCVKD